MVKIIIRYGIVGGTLSIALGLLNWFTISPYFDPRISQIIGYTSVLLVLMCIPMGIKYFRDQKNNGIVTLLQSIKIGLGITVITTLMVYCYTALFFLIAGDDYNKWQTEKLSPGDIQALHERMAQMPDYAVTPWFQGFIISVMVFLMGLMIVLFSTIMLKSNK